MAEGSPPSFTSMTVSNSDPHPLQLAEPSHYDQQDHNNPSMSKMRSYSSFDDRAPREIVHEDVVQPLSIGDMAKRETQVHISYNNNNINEQAAAPSMGAIRGDRGNSQPAGGGYLSYHAPPSHGDMARANDSLTGGYSGSGQDIPGGNYEGMSLTGPDFARLYPTMFQ